MSAIDPQTQDVGQDSVYGYIPTDWICIIFVTLFSLATFVHGGLAIRYRLWWMFPTVIIAGIGEMLGWAARLWSSQDINNFNPFLMQITTTIISPTPLVAANFIILGALIKYLGPQYSRISPKWYMIIFCSADFVSLIIQAIGGATASQAFQSNKDPNPGGNIMLAGIVVQMVAISIYVTLATEFLIRHERKHPVHGREAAATPEIFKVPARNVKLMLIGLSASTIFIFIRAVYRTIELSDGWTGTIIHTQVLFNALDGAMITLAIYTMLFFHPGVLLLPLLKNPHGARGADTAQRTSQELEGGKATPVEMAVIEP